MKFWGLCLLFLVINFTGLGVGSWLMDNGPSSDWYMSLDKAPWTPPGWVFGTAWTIIMICFSLYLAKLFANNKTLTVWVLFGVQFILNVSWNFVFFNQRRVLLALVIIMLLTALIFFYFIRFQQNTKEFRYLLTPYMIWLCLATSLNYYIYLYN